MPCVFQLRWADQHPGNPVIPGNPIFPADAFPLGSNLSNETPTPPQIMPLDFFQGGAALLILGTHRGV